jgi:hypothetical protein
VPTDDRHLVKLRGFPRGRFAELGFCAVALLMAGCGTTKSRTATEQLLTSSAVDQAVAQIDFRPLAGRNVYFDTQYITPIKGIGFVNAEYIVSSLRQQMTAAGCRLQEKPDTAEYVVEARVGALGADAHDVTYGIPASSALSTAAEAVAPAAPPIPAIPELAVAKRDDQRAAAKLAVFAYHRETRQALWQSGVATGSSTAKDVWVLGAGPFQRGTIHEGTDFAGAPLGLSLLGEEEEQIQPAVPYKEQHVFDALRRQQGKVRVVTFDDPMRLPETTAETR